MNPLLGIIEGFREIWSHKMRSALTLLSIGLGVGALMAMFAITQGMAESFQVILKEVGGVEKLRIVDSQVPEHQELIKDRSPGRTIRDVEAIRRSVPLVTYVSPRQNFPGRAKVVYKGKQVNLRLRGVDEHALEIDNHFVEKGRFFTYLDDINANRVIVLGDKHVRRLFRKENPIGKTVLVNGVSFAVVGVLRKPKAHWRGRTSYIPFRTMQRIFRAHRDDREKIDDILVQIRDAALFDSTIEQMRNVMQITHRGIDDYGFNTREDWMDYITTAVGGVRVAGGLIASIGLIVGGVGITNVSLASIKERTREIGIRRAIGANPMDVFTQIAMEAMVLAVLGGLAGLALGWGLLELIRSVAPADNAPVILIGDVLFSFSTALVVGLIAGVFPAWKAASMNPIQALRFE